MNQEKIKILYVAGFGRNGSTILGNILGEIPGFFHAGELNFVWERNLLENRRCGCGEPFWECEVWNRVFDGAFGGMERVDAREMARLQRTRNLALNAALTLLPARSAARRKFLKHLEQLYEEVGRATGSRVIIDSSKRPLYGYLLQTVPGVDLRVVHLIRDPRASAHSWLREKPQPDKSSQAYMLRFGPLESTLRWIVWNVLSEAFWGRCRGRYLRLRYEDFVRKPEESVRAILRLLDEEASDLPFVGETRVELGGGHTVSGNPNRFETGTVELQPDEEWTSGMKPGDRRLVTALALPLLGRFGYPVSPRSRSG